MMAMMSRLLFIALALFATMPASLCEAVCFEMSRGVTIDATHHEMPAHCGETSQRVGDSSEASPAAMAGHPQENPRSESACDSCELDSALLLVAAPSLQDGPPLGLPPHGFLDTAALIIPRARIEPRAPPDRDRSPYVSTRRPLLI